MGLSFPSSTMSRSARSASSTRTAGCSPSTFSFSSTPSSSWVSSSGGSSPTRRPRLWLRASAASTSRKRQSVLSAHSVPSSKASTSSTLLPLPLLSPLHPQPAPLLDRSRDRCLGPTRLPDRSLPLLLPLRLLSSLTRAASHPLPSLPPLL